MIKQEIKEAITQKDELVEEMVMKSYKQMRELGQFQTVYQIFGKLPISRIQKQQYQFLYDSLKHNVNQLLNRQDQLEKLLHQQTTYISGINIKTYKQYRQDKKDKEKETVTIGSYDFSYLVESCYNQKSLSGEPVFKSIGYIRNQDRKGKDVLGGLEPFIPDQSYINFKEIKYDITDIKMVLEQQKKLKKYTLQFMDQNKVQFSTRRFPSNAQIQRRADMLAKLFLLRMYRQQGRKAKQVYKTNEINMNRQRQIKKIKQQMDVQKVKQGELIEQMDLIKQKKMNQLAFAQFQNKNGDKAAVIKRSLQKIKVKVHEQSSAKNKLKILIAYKHNKGW